MQLKKQQLVLRNKKKLNLDITKEKQKMADKILAKVGAQVITEKDVDEFIMALGQRGAGYNSPEGRRAILNQLIDNKLLLLDAQRNLYEADAAFRAQLAKLKENLLINFAAEKAFASVNVTEDELKKYYDENGDKLTQGETVNASHILVATEDEATKILESITAGKVSFEDAAKQFSSCPSKDAGGNLGDFGKGQMVPEFDKVVFEMEVGEISKAPVKTQFGYHLIKLNSKSEAKKIEFAEVRDELYGMLTNEKRQKAYESKINQLKIMYPVDMAL